MKHHLLLSLGFLLGVSGPVQGRSPCGETPEQVKDALLTNHDIVDPQNNLTRIFDALNELQTGRRERPIRVALIGDSNHTLDYATDALRRMFAERFGTAGHGFIAAAKPWSWYDHADIRVTPLRGWKSYAISRPTKGRFKAYGPGSIVGEGHRGSAIRFRPARRGIQTHRSLEGATVHYLCRKRGGRFSVWQDGRRSQVIDTDCESTGWTAMELKTPAGLKKLDLRVDRGRVTLFGLSFEPSSQGVVVDNLSASSLNAWHLARLDETRFDEGLRARMYDLIILHTGTNMWSPRKNRRDTKRTIARIRKALGSDVSIIVMTPGDAGRGKKKRGFQWRMKKCAEEKREIAQASGVALWDYYAVMGGAGSIKRWVKARRASGDYVHPKASMSRLMFKTFGQSFLKSYGRYLESIDACPR